MRKIKSVNAEACSTIWAARLQRSEAKAPFRLVRLIFLGGLLVGAVVGLLIISARLLQALKGGIAAPHWLLIASGLRRSMVADCHQIGPHEGLLTCLKCRVVGGDGAPDVNETLKNLAINGAAIAGLGFIVRRDLRSSDRDKRIVEREESLAKLQVQNRVTWLIDDVSSCVSYQGQETLEIKLRLICILLAVSHSSFSWPLCAQVEVGSGDRVLPLASFRGTTRPVLLAGSKAYLQKAQAAAEPYRQARTSTAAAMCMRTAVAHRH